MIISPYNKKLLAAAVAILAVAYITLVLPVPSLLQSKPGFDVYAPTSTKNLGASRIYVSVNLSDDAVRSASLLTAKGLVYDTNGEPVGGVDVSAMLDNTKYTGKTDEDGAYSLILTAPDAPGRYAIEVKAQKDEMAASVVSEFSVFNVLKRVWDYPMRGLTPIVYAGNLDADVNNEVVGFNSLVDNTLILLDNNGSPLWSDTILGTLWSGAPDAAGTNLITSDLNGDGVDEVVAASTCNGRCSTWVYIYDGKGNKLMAYGNETSGAIHTIHLADLDADGLDEIVYGTNEGDVYAIEVGGNLIFKYVTDEKKHEANSEGWYGVWAVTVSDLEGDGVPEVIAGSGNGRICVLDVDGTLRWEYYAGSSVYRVRAADLDADGTKELIASVGGGVTISEMRNKDGVRVAIPKPNEIVVLDAEGSLSFRKRIGSGGFSFLIEAEDLDADGSAEVLVAYSGGTLTIFGPKGDEMWSRSFGKTISGLAVSDLEGDGLKEVIVAAGKIAVLGQDMRLMSVYDEETITGMVYVEDINNDGRKEVITASIGKILVLT